MIRRLRREEGYAALVALLAAACFAAVAAQIATTSRSGILGVNAAGVKARLAAGADAAFATALDHVLATNPEAAWRIDGRLYTERYNDLDAQITVEDERGKVPLKQVTRDQAESLFQRAGAAAGQAAAMASTLLLWREAGADAKAPAAGGVRPSAIQSIDDLRLLPGMTNAIYDALERYVTVGDGVAPFDRRYASPFALSVMGPAAAGFDEIMRARERAGQDAPFKPVETPVLPGRQLTVRVRVSDDRGDRMEAATLVELTGRGDVPYLVRSVAQ